MEIKEEKKRKKKYHLSNGLGQALVDFNGESFLLYNHVSVIVR